jgi:hypothetical protein
MRRLLQHKYRLGGPIHCDQEDTMKTLVLVAGVSVVALSGASMMRPRQPPGTQSTSVQQVWDREETYWPLVKARDLARYVDLWKGRFEQRMASLHLGVVNGY